MWFNCAKLSCSFVFAYPQLNDSSTKVAVKYSIVVVVVVVPVVAIAVDGVLLLTSNCLCL